MNIFDKYRKYTIKMDTNSDHSLIEKYISSLLSISQAKILLESQGLYDPLIPISEEIIRQLLQAIQPNVEKYGFFMGTIDIDTSKLTDPFFNSLKLKISYIQEHVPYAEVGGVYDIKESVIKDGKIDVVMYITSNAQDNEFLTKLQSTIIHELAHAYDDYMETINSKYGTSYMRHENAELIDRVQLSFYFSKGNTIEGKLATLINFILKSEMESEQNEFLSEVMRLSKMKVLTDPRNLTEYVSNTGFYKYMMKIKSYIKEIENLDGEERKRITGIFNKIYRDKGMTFEQMCGFLRKSFNYRKNELFKHVAKHIVELVETFMKGSAGYGRMIMALYEN